MPAAPELPGVRSTRGYASQQEEEGGNYSGVHTGGEP
jgi:hypothetical protein